MHFNVANEIVTSQIVKMSLSQNKTQIKRLK